MKQKFLTLIEKIFRDALATQAAALAFYTALALAPLAVLFLSVLSSLNFPDQHLVTAEIRQIFGPEASAFIETVIESSRQRSDLVTRADIWGLTILVISASAVFLQIQDSLNVIFGVPDTRTPSTMWTELRTFAWKRLFSFMMVFAFVIVMVASLLASVLINLWIRDVGTGLQFLHSILVFGVYTAIFTALFEWMPDREVPWRSAFFGGLITALLFSVGKSLISWYLSKAAFASAYGAAGSFLMLLVWVYYSSTIIYIGAEIASVINPLVAKTKAKPLKGKARRELHA